jgi:hypothetical protein
LDQRIRAFQLESGKDRVHDVVAFANEIKNAANRLLHPDRDQTKPLTQDLLDRIVKKTTLLVAVLSEPMV